jgi:putative glycosyltransferase (TIGR04372 family)
MRLLKAAARLTVKLSALPILVALYFISPFLKVKIARIRTDRIGHLASNTDAFLRTLGAGGLDPDTIRIFIADSRTANRQLLEMFKRIMPVIESRWLAKWHELNMALLEKTPFHEPLPWRGKAHAEFNAIGPRISFTAEEERRGLRELARLGIGERDWFVCFHNRDSAYLASQHPGRDFSYHDYRDCSVRSFLPAARLVTSRGGFALRMGSAFSEPLGEIGDPRIIDYAARHRTDFMDIYLLAKCRFLIGCDTGLTLVCTAFDVPVIYTNSPRLDFAPFHRRDIFIQKRYCEAATGRLLGYHEIMARGYERLFNARWLEKTGLRLIDNTPEEIADATREMLDRLDGAFHETAEDRARQERYRALFRPEHESYGFRSLIGRDFLAKNETSLFAPFAGATRVAAP